ncbi:VOC family protein [Propionibacteriaceae bacterium G57]|uniref:VOC family protein n=1 Tax=Aestuariimicrobium sp. G57 TaxID=3418485 RepID=UPI003DA78D1F
MSLAASISIAFPGNAADAFTFYQSVFGGDLKLFRYKDFPDMGMPDDAVAHASLTTDTFMLVGGDSIGETPSTVSDVYSIMLVPDSVEAAQELITALTADGGEIAMPFELAPWGDHYGQVRDQFGVLWQLDVGPAQEA